jgi:hypothetical protein
MRLLVLVFSALCISLNVSAKKVKFLVSMQGFTIATAGIHVMGDWQTAAGDTNGNWYSASQLMTKLATDTNMYELVVDIPAFSKYEYIFVNGDQSYEIEFVPDPCRVNPEIGGANTNRWFYLDSLSADTTTIGGFIFNGTAPAGKFFTRWIVDIKNVGQGTGLPHVIGTFNNWSTTALPMYSFTGLVYDNYTYLDSGAHEYRFLKDNSIDEKNTLVGSCKNAAGNRSIANASDIVLDSVCFAQCNNACFVLSTNDVRFDSEISILPAITHDFVHVTNSSVAIKNIAIFDVTGRKYACSSHAKNGNTVVDVSNLPAQAYILVVNNRSFRIQKM